MSYATAAEMLRAVGSERLKRLIPDFQTDSLTSCLEEALAVGAAKIESRIGHVYATPLALSAIVDSGQKASAQAQIRRVNIIFALEYLTLGIDKLPPGITSGISASDSWLASVAERKARIPGLSPTNRPVMKAFAPEGEVQNPLDNAIFEGFAFL